ncbi:MAG: hypothetical protein CVT66_08545 [Actinobacteria bacterium HGW-Actinobacteria-6]|nr:MAG: hypothetical protein CVT66_08545 [Actinobacteria bacterium HGW-Actinobacteria-6]
MDTNVIAQVPPETIEWLCAEENPAVATLTRREFLGLADDAATTALWERRNEYAPVATILERMSPDGSWATPGKDYQKYGGSLWQVHFLGELYASGDDERVQQAAAYAFSRQLADGSWSCNGRSSAAIPCLTANVGRALARLGFSRDERIIAALRYCVGLFDTFGCLTCGSVDPSVKAWGARTDTLNGYCHMLAPKLLLFLDEVPRKLWPDGAETLRDECVRVLREKQITRCLPEEARAFGEVFWSTPTGQRAGVRERFLAEHGDLHFKDKPGWLRFGFPLSYNSDALEALLALARVGEPRLPEYERAISVVREQADAAWRWKLRNTLNGKMLADIERKGEPSRWVTLRALELLRHFGG